MRQILLGIAAITMAMACLGSGAAQGIVASPEHMLFDSVNRERASRGLSVLTWDDVLAGAARQHAILMAKQEDLSHQFPGEPDLQTRLGRAGAKFSEVAENVAEGPTAENIHEGWMKSPGHRANILDPMLTAVGIAVVVRNGQLYAAQDFSRSVIALSRDQQEARIKSLLKAQGIHVVDDGSVARTACESGHTPDAAGHRSVFMMRFTTEDLSKLPDQLVQRIKSEHFVAASVGACPAADGGAFTQYQAAVLLYQ